MDQKIYMFKSLNIKYCHRFIGPNIIFKKIPLEQIINFDHIVIIKNKNNRHCKVQKPYYCTQYK